MKKRYLNIVVFALFVSMLWGCSDWTKPEAEDFFEMPGNDYYENLRDLNLDITLLQAQLPIDGSDFLTMIESWKASQEECGAYIEHGDWTMKVSHDGATLSSEGKFEDRDAEIAFTFNEKSDMESMTVSAHYTTGEILKKAGLNTILGMGTVFVVLIFISFIIYLLGYIPKFQEKLANKDKKVEEKKEAPVQAAPAPVAAAEDDAELVAVIAAAIAAAEGTSTDGFVVRSIKRRKSNRWN